jgi:hypothetical protein
MAVGCAVRILKLELALHRIYPVPIEQKGRSLIFDLWLA